MLASANFLQHLLGNKDKSPISLEKRLQECSLEKTTLLKWCNFMKLLHNTHSILKCLALVLISTVVLGVSNNSHSAPPPPINKQNVEDFFDIAFETQKLEHELVGATVAVVKDGEVFLVKGYGFSDLEKRIPVDPNIHLFRIASISKTFTWTAIMQLVEEGKLDLEADIQTYLDFKVPNTFKEPIRVKHLLTHTPGFEDQNIGAFPKTHENVIPLGTYLSDNLPERVRKPGTFISYSNYGSALAGYIVERVSGIQWATYIQQRILDPLKMTDTNVHQPMSDIHQGAHAKGYQYSGGEYTPTNHLFQHQTPDGVMSSTARDMATWMLTHLNFGQFNGASILNSETSRLMQSELFRQHPNDQPVLHGFYSSNQNGTNMYGHGGDLNQFHSHLSLLPQHDLGIFVSYNSDPGQAARSNIILAFLDYFFPEDFPEVIQPNLDINLDNYTGAWLSTRRNHSTFEKLSLLLDQLLISQDKGELVISGGSEVSRWIPVKQNYFRAKYLNTHLQFYQDGNGKVSHFSVEGGFGSFEKAKWHESPYLHGLLLLFVSLVTLTYLIRQIYTFIFNRRSHKVAPALDRCLATVTSLAILLLFFQLIVELSGDATRFMSGIPNSMHIVFILALFVLPLSIGVSFLAVRQWVNGTGCIRARLNYALLALVTVITVILMWYWNILGVYF